MTSNAPRYDIISTGSLGNAVVIEGEILIDVGVSFKALRPYYRQLKLVLCTHSHGDHFNPATVRRLAAERPTLRWGCCAWMVSWLVNSNVSHKQIDVLSTGAEARYSGYLSIIPVPLVHDVPNCGYYINQCGKTMLYATDTSSLDQITCKDLGLYMLEANHITEDIKRRIAEKRAAGDYCYEERAMHTHLSKEQCDDWFYRNGGPHSTLVYLHCHQEKEESA